MSSQTVEIHKSIIAGCIYSIPYVESFLHTGDEKLAAEHTDAHHRTYVDDGCFIICMLGVMVGM